RCPELFTDDKSLLADEYELDIKRLIMSEIIGEGAFGRVFKATMSPEKITKSSTGRVVAVKFLRVHALPEERRNLLLEIDAMKQLGHHQNLISIIACCTTGPEICLVMDYCPLGDLRNYLRSFRQTVEPSKDADFNPTTLLSYARQIVMGMEYLAEKKFVHRDLATRNILLSTKQLLKITDFGLTRDVYETNMYQPTSSRKLPYKWMPLETIFDQVFTVKSDVWSFGIVLWEIVTLGGCPYPGIPNENLFKLLKDGYRMEKPDNCGQELYQMMLACWHPTPSNRPTFRQLRLKLEGLLEATQPYIDLSVMISDDYYQPDNSSSNDTILQNNSFKLSFKCDDHSWPQDPNIDQQERYIELPKTTTSLSGLPSHAQSSAHSSSEYVVNGNWKGKGKAKSSIELRNTSCPPTKCSRRKIHNGNCSKSNLYTTPYSRIPIKISRSYNDVSDSTKRKKRSKPGQNGSENIDNSDAHEHMNVSHESSSNLTCSEGVGSDDIDSSFSSLNYSKSVFHTPSLKHGLLNLLSRVGRRRLGNSDWRKSFSLTEVSNIHMANNVDIKLGSTSAI
ncbi:fibroblast growth factor receptor 1, partial [Patella vulgata]|uniref:fibroblast growth factor receptor 1 n=1 Tax=Patella vulgata TaxID=6465 RepID=UPI0024A7D09F